MSMCVCVCVCVCVGGGDVNRFWDRTTWIMAISGQLGPKEELDLLWKNMAEIRVLIECRR